MEESQIKFDEICNTFHERVTLYLERMVGKDESEDLTQEVFVKINKGLDDFKGQSALSTWIYRIATNTALDRIRSRFLKQKTQTISMNESNSEPEGEGLYIHIDQASLSAEREAIRNEMNDCIREFVDKLPINYRTIIILSEIKDLKNRQIADILGIRLGTVKIRLHRARARLRELFKEGCDFYHDDSGSLACDRKQEKSGNSDD